MFCKSLETSATGLDSIGSAAFYLLCKAAGTSGTENQRASHNISSLAHIIPVCFQCIALEIQNFHNQWVLPKYLLCWNYKNPNVLKNSDS